MTGLVESMTHHRVEATISITRVVSSSELRSVISISKEEDLAHNTRTTQSQIGSLEMSGFKRRFNSLE